jgi:hypothetical protein
MLKEKKQKVEEFELFILSMIMKFKRENSFPEYITPESMIMTEIYNYCSNDGKGVVPQDRMRLL